MKKRIACCLVAFFLPPAIAWIGGGDVFSRGEAAAVSVACGLALAFFVWHDPNWL